MVLLHIMQLSCAGYSSSCTLLVAVASLPRYANNIIANLANRLSVGVNVDDNVSTTRDVGMVNFS